MNRDNLCWKEKSKRTLLETPVFRVTERLSESPDGKTGAYIVNECRDWVIVIPEDGDDFLMVTQWRHGEQGLSTEFPGGVIDDGESPEQGAARELLEETGAKAGTLIKLGSMNPNPALFQNHFHVFLAKNLEYTGSQHLDSDEYVNYSKIPKSEVIKNIGGPDYPHALMASAMGLYLSYEYGSKINQKG
ncbi:MAG: NUDIX hydrolase [Treponema sp.]|nr:NUDIX hydrolase [Treponema sp.]